MNDRLNGVLTATELKTQIAQMITTQSNLLSDYQPVGADYPFIIIRIGKEMDDNDEIIRNQVLRLLPAYENCLMYYKYDIDSAAFYCNGEQTDDNSLHEELALLFEGSSFFQRYTQLIVYYIVDSEALNRYEDIRQFFSVLDTIKDRIGIGNQYSHLMVTINEKVGYDNERSAKELKNKFSNYADDINNDYMSIVRAVYLISNKSSDGSFCRDEQIGRIISDLVVLQNCGNEEYVSAVRSSWIHAVAFNTVEKPVAKIAEACATEGIRHIGEIIGDVSEAAEYTDMSLDSKLGLERGDVFHCFEPIIEQFMESFPTREQLELFPRCHSDDVGDLLELNMRQFDELTIGAWSSYIKRVVLSFEQRLNEDKSIENLIRDQFSSYIRAQFPLFELMTLTRKQAEIKACFRNAAENINTAGDDLYKGVRKELNRRLLENEKISQLFCDEAVKLGDNGKKMSEYWTKFHNEILKASTLGPSDRHLKDFYSKIVTKFFDLNGAKIKETLIKISSIPELQDTMMSCFKDLIQFDQIFSEPFERELQIRLAATEPKVAQNEIRLQLTGNNVRTRFVPTGSAIGEPVLSVIMLRADSELHRYLQENLSERANYFNTNNGDSADVIRVFCLNKLHLI